MVILQTFHCDFGGTGVSVEKKNGIASSSGKCCIEIFLSARIVGGFYLMRKVGQNNTWKISDISSFVCKRFMVLLLVNILSISC